MPQAECVLGTSRGLEAQPRGAQHPPAGILPGQATTRNASPSFSPKAEPQDAALLCHPTLPALPPPFLGRVHCAARSDHSWGRRVLLLGSAWTVKEHLEKSQECRHIWLVSTTLSAHTAGHPTPLLKGYTCPCDHTMPHPVGGEEKEDNLSTHQPALHQHHSRQPPSCSKCSSPLGTSRGPVVSELIPQLSQQAPGQQGKAGSPQTAQLQGLHQLLGTPWAVVSWKPYQALRHSRALPGLGSQGARCLKGTMAPQAQPLPEDGAFCHCRTNHNIPSPCWVDALKEIPAPVLTSHHMVLTRPLKGDRELTAGEE